MTHRGRKRDKARRHVPTGDGHNQAHHNSTNGNNSHPSLSNVHMDPHVDEQTTVASKRLTVLKRAKPVAAEPAPEVVSSESDTESSDVLGSDSDDFYCPRGPSFAEVDVTATQREGGTLLRDTVKLLKAMIVPDAALARMAVAPPKGATGSVEAASMGHTLQCTASSEALVKEMVSLAAEACRAHAALPILSTYNVGVVKNGYCYELPAVPQMASLLKEDDTLMSGEVVQHQARIPPSVVAAAYTIMRYPRKSAAPGPPFTPLPTVLWAGIYRAVIAPIRNEIDTLVATAFEDAQSEHQQHAVICNQLQEAIMGSSLCAQTASAAVLGPAITSLYRAVARAGEWVHGSLTRLTTQVLRGLVLMQRYSGALTISTKLLWELSDHLQSFFAEEEEKQRPETQDINKPRSRRRRRRREREATKEKDATTKPVTSESESSALPSYSRDHYLFASLRERFNIAVGDCERYRGTVIATVLRYLVAPLLQRIPLIKQIQDVVTSFNTQFIAWDELRIASLLVSPVPVPPPYKPAATASEKTPNQLPIVAASTSQKAVPPPPPYEALNAFVYGPVLPDPMSLFVLAQNLLALVSAFPPEHSDSGDYNDLEYYAKKLEAETSKLLPPPSLSATTQPPRKQPRRRRRIIKLPKGNVIRPVLESNAVAGNALAEDTIALSKVKAGRALHTASWLEEMTKYHNVCNQTDTLTVPPFQSNNDDDNDDNNDTKDDDNDNAVEPEEFTPGAVVDLLAELEDENESEGKGSTSTISADENPPAAEQGVLMTKASKPSPTAFPFIPNSIFTEETPLTEVLPALSFNTPVALSQSATLLHAASEGQSGLRTTKEGRQRYMAVYEAALRHGYLQASELLAEEAKVSKTSSHTRSSHGEVLGSKAIAMYAADDESAWITVADGVLNKGAPNYAALAMNQLGLSMEMELVTLLSSHRRDDNYWYRMGSNVSERYVAEGVLETTQAEVLTATELPGQPYHTMYEDVDCIGEVAHRPQIDTGGLLQLLMTPPYSPGVAALPDTHFSFADVNRVVQIGFEAVHYYLRSLCTNPALVVAVAHYSSNVAQQKECPPLGVGMVDYLFHGNHSRALTAPSYPKARTGLLRVLENVLRLVHMALNQQCGASEDSPGRVLAAVSRLAARLTTNNDADAVLADVISGGATPNPEAAAVWVRCVVLTLLYQGLTATAAAGNNATSSFTRAIALLRLLYIRAKRPAESTEAWSAEACRAAAISYRLLNHCTWILLLWTHLTQSREHSGCPDSREAQQQQLCEGVVYCTLLRTVSHIVLQLHQPMKARGRAPTKTATASAAATNTPLTSSSPSSTGGVKKILKRPTKRGPVISSAAETLRMLQSIKEMDVASNEEASNRSAQSPVSFAAAVRGDTRAQEISAPQAEALGQALTTLCQLLRLCPLGSLIPPLTPTIPLEQAATSTQAVSGAKPVSLLVTLSALADNISEDAIEETPCSPEDIEDRGDVVRALLAGTPPPMVPLPLLIREEEQASSRTAVASINIINYKERLPELYKHLFNTVNILKKSINK